MIALFAGVALAFSSSPHNRWPLAIVGLFLLYRRTEERERKKTARSTFVCFFVMFLIGLSWSRQFSVPGYVLLSAVEALVFVLAMVCVPKDDGWRRALGFISAFTLAEFTRIYLPWGGLPMGGFTTGQAGNWLSNGATIIGEIGMVPLLCAAAVVTREVLRVHDRQKIVAAVALSAIVAVPAWGSVVDLPTTGTLRVAAVQGGGEQALLRNEQDPGKVFAAHEELTGDIRDADLIVWPEDVVSSQGPIAGTLDGETLAELARSQDATIVAGVIENSNDGFRNLAVAWDRNGNMTDEYEKVHRVPFGEYVPYRDFVDGFADLSQVPVDAGIGTGPAIVDVDNHKVGVAISFEGLFSRSARSAVRDGGELLLIPTNAASYRSPKVAAAQIQAARFRALETGRWVVQSSPTGQSAIVDSAGDVRARSTIGPPAVLRAEATLYGSRTPYMSLGDLPLFALAVLGLVICQPSWLNLLQFLKKRADA